MSAIPRWKFWLSHIFEFHIESRRSSVNDELHLALSRGRFQLYTENAIYSFEDLYDNFFDSFKSIELDILPEKAEVLILGYGMASIPFMLEKKFHRNYRYTGIELDEEIIDLAHQYMIPRLKNPQQIIQADAYIFLESSDQLYDLIIVDLFVDNIIPTKFEKFRFLNLLKSHIKTGGLVMYNRLANDEYSKNQAGVFLEDIFKPIFEEASAIKVNDNWIIISDKNFSKGN